MRTGTAAAGGGPGCDCRPEPEQASSERLRLREAALPGAVRSLRRSFRRWAAASGADEDTVDAMVLLTDEAITNVVEHAAREHPCTVELLAGARGCSDGLAVTVQDDGEWRPPPEDPGYRGRGTTLISRLADRSTITTSPHGTTVRMCWSTRRPGADAA